MAYTVDILNAKKVADNGLLSKIQIGGKMYEIKDLIARENIGSLSVGLDKIAGDLAALSYVKATGQFADDAAIKSYVDAQVGAINKFDVHVLTEGEDLPEASAETMYILYLKPDADSASGDFPEIIRKKIYRTMPVYPLGICGFTSVHSIQYPVSAGAAGNISAG